MDTNQYYALESKIQEIKNRVEEATKGMNCIVRDHFVFPIVIHQGVVDLDKPAARITYAMLQAHDVNYCAEFLLAQLVIS